MGLPSAAPGNRKSFLSHGVWEADNETGKDTDTRISEDI